MSGYPPAWKTWKIVNKNPCRENTENNLILENAGKTQVTLSGGDVAENVMTENVIPKHKTNDIQIANIFF